MRDIDRRTVLRAGLAGGLAAAGTGVLAACDTTSAAPGSSGGTPTAVAGGTAGGSLILPDSPLVAVAERARFATGKVRSHDISLVPGMVDLGGPTVTTWSYDGTVPGPVIRVNKGDTVRATFTNKIAQPTSVHWHGVSLRNDMDGTLVTQQPIAPDVTSRLELTGNMSSYSWGFNGTAQPMGGGFIGPSYPRLVRVQQDKRLRITWVNTTKMWHPMHIHGHTFQVNGSGPLKDTVNVLPGQTVTCDFDTNNPGQWDGPLPQRLPRAGRDDGRHRLHHLTLRPGAPKTPRGREPHPGASMPPGRAGPPGSPAWRSSVSAPRQTNVTAQDGGRPGPAADRRAGPRGARPGLSPCLNPSPGTGQHPAAAGPAQHD